MSPPSAMPHPFCLSSGTSLAFFVFYLIRHSATSLVGQTSAHTSRFYIMAKIVMWCYAKQDTKEKYFSRLQVNTSVQICLQIGLMNHIRSKLANCLVKSGSHWREKTSPVFDSVSPVSCIIRQSPYFFCYICLSNNTPPLHVSSVFYQQKMSEVFQKGNSYLYFLFPA